MHPPKITNPTSRPATALALLLAINIFNYLDRYVLAAVLPKVEAEFAVEKATLGWLNSVFLLSYMFASPVFGWLGDRAPRWRLIAVGVVVWSLASGGTGLAPTFAIMLLTRALIGVGEAAYGPVAPSVISDLYPVEKRGAKLAWFYVAIPVGSALGFAFGGYVAGTGPHGWRHAFYYVVPPGIILGAMCLLMREPSRGAADGTTHRQATWADYLGLTRIPSFVLCTLGMAAMTFALGGVGVWVPTYYLERESTHHISAQTLTDLEGKVDARVITSLRPLVGDDMAGTEALNARLKDVLGSEDFLASKARIAEVTRDPARSMSLEDINMVFGGIVVATGLAATLAGGWLGDRLKPRFPGSYFLVSGTAMLLGCPLFLLALTLPMPWAWVFVFLAVFFLFFNTGPANTIIANVTHPAVRSSAYAVNILIIHLLGDVPSPPIVGWCGDHLSLRVGMYILSGATVVSGILWLWGARYLQRDTELAPKRLT